MRRLIVAVAFLGLVACGNDDDKKPDPGTDDKGSIESGVSDWRWYCSQKTTVATCNNTSGRCYWESGRCIPDSEW
jgi:hypothetical protein